MNKHTCAVCGADMILEDSVVCDICYWEADSVQEDDPDYRGGANKESLNEARAEWKAKQTK